MGAAQTGIEQPVLSKARPGAELRWEVSGPRNVMGARCSSHQCRSPPLSDAASGKHFAKEEWLAPGEHRSPRKSVRTRWGCVGGPPYFWHVTSSLPFQRPLFRCAAKVGRRWCSLALAQQEPKKVAFGGPWTGGAGLDVRPDLFDQRHFGEALRNVCVSATPNRCAHHPAVSTSAGPRVLSCSKRPMNMPRVSPGWAPGDDHW